MKIDFIEGEIVPLNGCGVNSFSGFSADEISYIVNNTDDPEIMGAAKGVKGFFKKVGKKVKKSGKVLKWFVPGVAPVLATKAAVKAVQKKRVSNQKKRIAAKKVAAPKVGTQKAATKVQSNAPVPSRYFLPASVPGKPSIVPGIPKAASVKPTASSALAESSPVQSEKQVKPGFDFKKLLPFAAIAIPFLLGE